jgi:putative flippase GtrA
MSSMPPPSRRLEAGAGPLLPLLAQAARFGVVGLGATLVHVLVYAGLIELLGTAPLLANALGFATAVNVSFIGHRHWTFSDQRQARAQHSLARFWVVALLGFALNTLFVWLVTGPLGLAYGWAIPLIAGVTPLLTFVSSRVWAFRA